MKVWLLILREGDHGCTDYIEAVCDTEERALQALEETVERWRPSFPESIIRRGLVIEEREVLS